MIGARAALIAAMLAASIVAPASRAPAQPNDAADVAEALRPGVTAYRTGNLPVAEAAFRSLAAAGNADAIAWLGVVLLDRGATKEGVLWLQRAVDGGSIEGTHRLALAFAEGAGTQRNDARAVELFEKAAEADHKRAQLNLGTLYFRGQGVPRDLIQARSWLEKAASDGDPYALYALGRAMSENLGPAIADPVRAADLYRHAAEKGHPFAALRYALALVEGNGAKRDQATAQRWLVYLNDNGFPEAALALGDISARTPASRDKAANDKAVQIAVAWYESSANAGVASAQFKLANAYFAGVGVERDASQAQRWYARAAQQGLPEAQHALGVWLIGGVAGQQDPVEGLKWLVLAERNGHPDSKTVLAKALEKTSEADRWQAEALAARFMPMLERPIDEGAPRLIAPLKL